MHLSRFSRIACAAITGATISLSSLPLASAIVVGAPTQQLIGSPISETTPVNLTLKYPEQVNEFDPLPEGWLPAGQRGGLEFEVREVLGWDLNDSSLWPTLRELDAKNTKAEGTSQKLVMDAQGIATGQFSPGVYKVTQLTHVKGQAETSDFLVVLPIGSQPSGQWDYDAEVFLKLHLPEDTPVEPTDPSDPTNPVDPTTPSDPINPVDPTDPIIPGDPTIPSTPTQPSNPSLSPDGSTVTGKIPVFTQDQAGPLASTGASVWGIGIIATIALIGGIVLGIRSKKEDS